MPSKKSKLKNLKAIQAEFQTAIVMSGLHLLDSEESMDQFGIDLQEQQIKRAAAGKFVTLFTEAATKNRDYLIMSEETGRLVFADRSAKVEKINEPLFQDERDAEFSRGLQLLQQGIKHAFIFRAGKYDGVVREIYVSEKKIAQGFLSLETHKLESEIQKKPAFDF